MTALVQIPALALTNVSKFLNLLVLHFPHWLNKDNNCSYLIILLWLLNDLIDINRLLQCWAEIKLWVLTMTGRTPASRRSPCHRFCGVVLCASPGAALRVCSRFSFSRAMRSKQLNRLVDLSYCHCYYYWCPFLPCSPFLSPPPHCPMLLLHFFLLKFIYNAYLLEL